MEIIKELDISFYICSDDNAIAITNFFEEKKQLNGREYECYTENKKYQRHIGVSVYI